MKSTYDIRKTYQDNYDNGPFFDGPFPQIINSEKKVEFLGHTLHSTLGVPAGPLINEKYTTLYGRLGFDIVTYKTVRSQYKPCHPLPNCVYVSHEIMNQKDIGQNIHPVEKEKILALENISITNSFGVPSQPIEEWQPDMEKALHALDSNQMLIGSALGSADTADGWVQDIARTCALIKDTGVKVIELDLSCPNINKSKAGAGSVYLDKDFSEAVIKACKKEIGDLPLLIKVGYFDDLHLMENIIETWNPYVEGIVAINTIRRRIVDQEGKQVLPGDGREYGGVCGAAIKKLAQQTVKDIILYRNRKGFDFVVVGCGGVTSAADFDEYYAMGCNAVMTATGSMWDPYLAHKWKDLQNCNGCN